MDKGKHTSVLGISAYYHDAAAALVVGGKIVAAAHEERFTRKKHDESFPKNSIKYCLEEAGLEIEDLDAVVFYDKPYLKFERLLETYHSFAPQGLLSFIAAMKAWVGNKLFTRSLIWKGLREIKGSSLLKKPKLLFSEHHLSHAGSAFYPSPYDRAAILTIDGVGEWATTTIALGEGGDIRILKEMHFPHSLGLLYSAFTYWCGFKVNSGEYKLMGLAPYGEKGGARVKNYKELIYKNLIDCKEDGSLFLKMEYFNFAAGFTMCKDKLWTELFKLPPRKADSELTQEYMDLALAIQEVTDEIVVRLARTAKKETGAEYLVMAGGVALNCVSNFKIHEAKIFKDIWVQPAAGDAGGALGAALAAYYLFFEKERSVGDFDSMQGAYLGPSFCDSKIERFLENESAPFKVYKNDNALFEDVAQIIAEGNVVGWFQGKMEWGPRALGNRSILADPRNSEMQKKLNLKIKFREGFRPFAPSVLEEDMENYFETKHKSPYMLFVAPVSEGRRKPLPPINKTLSERLNSQRSDIPSVTHLDYSARLQTVSKKTNEKYWNLINAFKNKTGYGLLVNTSFNVRGEPIVCTPKEAYQCFMDTEMDYLVMGNILLSKKDQPTVFTENKIPRAYALD